MSKGI